MPNVLFVVAKHERRLYAQLQREIRALENGPLSNEAITNGG